MKKWLLPLSLFTILGACSSGPGDVSQGTLAPCPNSPNCVSTREQDTEHGIAPYPYSGNGEETRQRLLKIITDYPRTRLISTTDVYIHAEFRSKFWRFVDDVEFLLDDDSQTVQFRSASRLGYSDLGVNRKRMEEIRALYQQE